MKTKARYTLDPGLLDVVSSFRCGLVLRPRFSTADWPRIAVVNYTCMHLRTNDSLHATTSESLGV
jgi:hypothetical protein